MPLKQTSLKEERSYWLDWRALCNRWAGSDFKNALKKQRGKGGGFSPVGLSLSDFKVIAFLFFKLTDLKVRKTKSHRTETFLCHFLYVFKA